MTRKIFILLILAAAALSSCLDDIEEVPLDDEAENISPPAMITAASGDRQILLSWSTVEGASVYRVYRALDPVEVWSRVSETADTFFLDETVSNGLQYFYSVSSVTPGGVESERSEAAPALASVYSLLIDSGLPYTGSREVELTLTAPTSTALMRISDTPDLGSAVWELYSPTRAWVLPEGDGQKTVYASYQDGTGTFSPTVSANIELDTWCGIESITVSPTPMIYAPGSIIHVEMRVEGDETEGSGSLEIEGLPAGSISLRDDGRDGDPAAGDGIYEADYRFPSGYRGTGLVATGYFTDRAGNEATPTELESTISFTDPPDAVELIGTTGSTTESITIVWEESAEEGFTAYRIYRGTEPGVTGDPALLAARLDSRSAVTYSDAGLDQAVTYYYRIFVVNDLGEMSGSNEISASTVDALPAAAVLSPPSAVGADRLSLDWTMNTDTDFAEYRIYRATAPGVTSSSTLVSTIDDRETTWLDDEGLDTTANTYYYRVVTFDAGGKSSRSNEVSTAIP